MAAVLGLPAHLTCLAIAELREAGVAVEPVLRDAGLAPDQVADPRRWIPFRSYALVIEAAARLLGDPAFGLRLGQALQPNDLDLLGYICLNSATLGDALANMERYHNVYSEGVRRSVRPQGDQVALVIDVLEPDAIGLPQPLELALSANHRQISSLLGALPQLSYVELSHPRVGPAAVYRRFLGAPVRFGAARNATVFPKALLATPIRAADRRLLDILKRQADEALRQRHGDGDLRDAVRNVVAPRLRSGVPTIGDVARELGMSSRTLARRLRDDGATYRGVLNTLRQQLAVRYLHDSRHSQAQIAYLLGFTDVSSFSHAFKRWTGSSPSQFRE